MGFLYLLEGLRTPFLDFLMLILTRAGEETVFIVIAMIYLWCVNKYDAYMLLFVGFMGTQISQLLKVTFRVMRPWVIDPEFKAVSAAIPAATGYSFPSGHTQTAVGTFGSVAATQKNKFIKFAAVLLALTVAFSRMYLGVHTPKDVITSFIIATLLIIVFSFIFKFVRGKKRAMRITFSVLIIFFIAQIIFLANYLKGSEAELISGLKNAYKMLGSILGLFVVYELDEKYIHFETSSTFLGQIIKVVLGLISTLAVKEICYMLFAFIPFQPISRGISYFIMVVFAGSVWPLAFPFINKICIKKPR